MDVGHCGYSQVSEGREEGIVDGIKALQCVSGKERVEIEFSVRVKPYSVLQFFLLLLFSLSSLFSTFSLLVFFSPLPFLFLFLFTSPPPLLLYFSLTAEGRVRCVNSLWREATKKKRSGGLFNL